MALRKSTQAAKRVMAPSADGANCVIPVFGEHVTVAGAFALNDVIEMIPWPAGTIIQSLKLHTEDLDSAGPSVTLDFGVLTGQYLMPLDDAGNARACGTEFGAALTTGQAGGSLDVAAASILGRAPSLLDRSIGFKIAAAPATLVAGAAIRVSAQFAPAPQGVAFV